MSRAVTPGHYTARAVAPWIVDEFSTGTLYARITFVVEDEGPEKGKRVNWTGYLNKEANTRRTLLAMRLCGWTGDTPLETNDPSIGTNLVKIVVENDVDKSGVPNGYSRVAFVNEIDGQTMRAASKLEPSKAQALAEKFRAMIKADPELQSPSAPEPRRATTPVPDEAGDDEIPF